MNLLYDSLLGTGKTATLVESILRVLKYHPGARVLACASSNEAADLICSRVLSAAPAAHIILGLFRLYAAMRDPKLVPVDIKPHSLYEDGAHQVPSLPLLLDYNLVVTTNTSSGILDSVAVPRDHFTHILIDEAGEALCAETLIPLSLASEKTTVVLAGDHLQVSV